MPNEYGDIVIVNSKDEILFLKRSEDTMYEPNKFGLPGGKLKIGEAKIDGAIRETEEEAGIAVENPTLLGQFGNSNGSTSYYYRAMSDTKPTLSDEHTEFKYMTLEEAIDAGEEVMMQGLGDRLVALLSESVDEAKVNKSIGMKTINESINLQYAVEDIMNAEFEELLNDVSKYGSPEKNIVDKTMYDIETAFEEFGSDNDISKLEKIVKKYDVGNKILADKDISTELARLSAVNVIEELDTRRKFKWGKTEVVENESYGTDSRHSRKTKAVGFEVQAAGNLDLTDRASDSLSELSREMFKKENFDVNIVFGRVSIFSKDEKALDSAVKNFSKLWTI